MLSTDSEVRSIHWLAAPCEGTTEEVWYDWSVYRISSTNSIRTTCESAEKAEHFFMWGKRNIWLVTSSGGGEGGGRLLVVFIFLQKVAGLVSPKFTAAVPSLLTGNCEWIVVFNISYFLVGRKQIDLCTGNNKLFCYNIPDCHWLIFGRVALTKFNPAADHHAVRLGYNSKRRDFFSSSDHVMLSKELSFYLIAKLHARERSPISKKMW